MAFLTRFIVLLSVILYTPHTHKHTPLRLGYQTGLGQNPLYLIHLKFTQSCSLSCATTTTTTGGTRRAATGFHRVRHYARDDVHPGARR